MAMIYNKKKIFQKRRRNFFTALFVLFVFAALLTIVLWWILIAHPTYKEKADAKLQDAQDTATSTLVRRPIDGLMVTQEEASSTLALVMIDNLAEAMPQAGINNASLVIEAPVEGGATRWLTVFAIATSTAKIGPVRSARPYYLDWAKEFDEALYAHVGGSPQALLDIKTKKIVDLNEFYRGEFFWRDRSRPAPHNVYTSSELLNNASEKYFNTTNIDFLQPWMFKDDALKTDRGQATSTLIYFDGSTVEWKYNKEKNVYERWEGGKKQADETGAVIFAKNLAVRLTDITVLDEIGRREIRSLGSGKAIVFRDGRRIEGTWKKAGLNSRTRFYGSDGREIEFNAGRTWVEVVEISNFQ